MVLRCSFTVQIHGSIFFSILNGGFPRFWGLFLLVSDFPQSVLWAITALFSPKSQFHLLNSERLPGSAFVPHFALWSRSPFKSVNWANSIAVYFHSLQTHCPSLTNVHYLENHSSVCEVFFLFLVLGIRRVNLVTVAIFQPDTSK